MSDLSRLGHKELNLVEHAILDGTEPVEPIIEQRLAEQRARETERRARAERQAQWEQQQADWRAARADIEHDITQMRPTTVTNNMLQDSVTLAGDGTTKRLNVIDPRRSAYSRVIKTRPVTLTCGECGQTVTEEHFPGATPKYCVTCLPAVKRRQTVARVRRHREQQRLAAD